MRRRVRKVRLIWREYLEQPGCQTSGFCSRCSRQVETLTLNQAGWILQAEDPELLTLLEHDLIHAIQPERSPSRICTVSLFQWILRRCQDDTRPITQSS